MEIVLAIYLTIAGVLFAAHKEGMVKDDTYQETIKFELQAAKDTVAHLEKKVK